MQASSFKSLKHHKKSSYRSCAGSHFYGIDNEIWADFGPVGNTEKKIRLIMSNFWGQFFFMFSWAKKMWRHCSVHTKKLHNIAFVKKILILILIFFAKNRLNVHNPLFIPARLLYNDFGTIGRQEWKSPPPRPTRRWKME